MYAWIMGMLGGLFNFLISALLVIVAVAVVAIVGSWAWNVSGAFIGASGSTQTRNNMDGLLTYAGKTIEG